MAWSVAVSRLANSPGSHCLTQPFCPCSLSSSSPATSTVVHRSPSAPAKLLSSAANVNLLRRKISAPATWCLHLPAGSAARSPRADASHADAATANSTSPAQDDAELIAQQIQVLKLSTKSCLLAPHPPLVLFDKHSPYVCPDA